MHLGLDFDNTLACYDITFAQAAKQRGLVPEYWSGGKRALRDYLRNQGEGGELAWQTLQGYVYGELMPQARLMPGAGWFLLYCKARGIQVSIVSHKTEYSQKDPKRIPLREAAREWMTEVGFFDLDRYAISPEAVYFEPTRHAKVERIHALGCTHFVDDLPEVLSHEGFSAEIKKILYDPDIKDQDLAESIIVYSNWRSIGEALLGVETEADLLSLAQDLLPDFDVKGCQPASGGGNSRVYKVSLHNGSTYALKRYPEFLSYDRNRLSTEVAACRLLHNHGLDRVPVVIRKDLDNQIGVFEWIKGNNPASPNSENLSQLLAFVAQLNGLRESKALTPLSNATEACFSGQEICRQIQTRRDRFAEFKMESSDITSFLETIFDPLLPQVVDWAKHYWPQDPHFNEALPVEHQTLSPSDLGFHNAILGESGNLHIIDLEYFGWDDPVKLASDFWWHPGMTLDPQLRKRWITEVTGIFHQDEAFSSRLYAAHPLYGLRWAMIVLKPFMSNEVAHRASANFLQEQLGKSIDLCQRVSRWIGEKNPKF